MKTHPIVLAVLLAGCATQRPISTFTPGEVSAAATVERDEFRKTTTVRGMAISLDGGMAHVNLTAIRMDGWDWGYWLTFTSRRSSYAGWAFWSTAVDEDGRTFDPESEPTREVLRDGGTVEVISFMFERDYLEGKRTSGVRFRIDGQRARQELTLPGNYVDGFLTRVDAGL